MAGDVERAGRKVHRAAEEDAFVLDIVRPFFKKLNVLEVVRLPQRSLVEFFEMKTGEVSIRGKDFFDSVGEEPAHRGGGAGKIWVGKIEAMPVHAPPRARPS